MTPSDLEGTDRRILELLAADGRMSFTDLGRATGLSTSAVHQRVKRLEQRGLIQGYGATVGSVIATPTFIGSPSGSPVTLISPPMACSRKS